MDNHSLQFVASATVCPSDIRKIRQHVLRASPAADPLHTMLVTPLFAAQGTLRSLRQMAEEGRRVVFDSGGYYVQTGRIEYDHLYLPLLRVYQREGWASLYTLPDHVPLSQDSPEVVERKVNDTITFGTLFFQEMPDDLKPRAMPVVQGHTFAQVDACLEAYLRLGVRWIGFGSFGTFGKNSQMNVATQSAVELAEYVIGIAHANGVKVHLFGLGVPALVAMLKGISADSFDSSSWLKAAGFGQVFLPFMRAYTISHRSTKSELQLGIQIEKFNQWRELTGHRCQYCDDIRGLQDRKMHRAVHNLLVVSETVAMANNGNHEHIREIYDAGSPRYREEYDRWLR